MPKPGPQLRRHDTRLAAVIEPAADGAEQSVGGKPWGGTRGDHSPDGADRSPQRAGVAAPHHNHNGERSIAAGEVSVGVEGAARAILANDMPALRSFIGLGGKPRIVTRRFLGPVPLPKPYDGSRILAERSSLPHLAARCGNEEALRLLVDAGYYVGQPDSNDDTALILALRHCPRALHGMITQGKERRLRDVHPRTGRAFIHELVATPQPSRAGFRRMPLLEFLVAEYGVNPREPDRDGLTPLDLAQAHYLQLGREADAIVAFLEDPPRARTSAQTALSRGVAGLARHPVARFVVLFLTVAVHTVMYMVDTHDRGTERPFICPAATTPSADGELVPISWEGTVFAGCPGGVIAPQNNTDANHTSPSAQATLAVVGQRRILQNTSSSRGEGFAEVNDTSGLHFADVFVNRTVRGPARGTIVQQRFVAYGFRDQRVSLPFAMDIVDHVVFDWEADTGVIAAKLLTIIIGGAVGALVFGLVGHMILRDVFRLGIFGYDPWVDLTRPGSTSTENSKRDAEQGFFTNPATAPEPDAATDDGDIDGAAESALFPASDASPPERSLRYSPREASNPLSQPTAFNARAGDLPSHPTTDGAAGDPYVPASNKPGAGAPRRARGEGKEVGSSRSYVHEVGGGLASMLLGYHPSPAVTASVGRGRGVLLLYGFLTGVFCGGLVFNALLDEGVVGGDVGADSVLYMRSDVRHFDGEPVLRGELWYVSMSLTLCLLPLVIVTALDEMGQSLARQQFLPTAWFGRFGLETWQVAWPRIRVAASAMFLLAWWTVICLILLQDVRYEGWLFTFDDLPATLLAPPSPSVNIFVGGVALLLDVMVLMQSWGLPRLQALVTFTAPFVPKPAASAKAPTRFAAVTAGGGASASAMDVEPDTGDDRVDVEIARRRRRDELLQGVLTAPSAPGKRSVRLTGIEREEAKHGTMAAANRGSGATHEIVSVTDAFKIPLTGIRGNIYWLLWTLVPWLAVLDAVYEAKYIVLVVNDPDGMHTTSPIYPSLGHGTIFGRVSEDRGAGLDVLWFSLAMLPCAAAALWFLMWAFSNSGLFRSCFPAAYAIPPLPAVDERTLEVVCSTVPCDRAKLRIHQRFVNRGVTDLPRSRLEPVRDFHNGGKAADAVSDDYGDDPGSNAAGINGNPASVYDSGGRSAVVDPFACAYRDDVVRLGSLLDADPSVINERGGIGLRVARRPSANFSNDVGESSFMARVPGLLGADGPDGPSFEALSPGRDSPTLRPVSLPQQRVASLLSHGDPSMYAATPLHYAVLGNARSSVSALLSRGANPRMRTMSGLCTAEELAEMMHFEGLASLLRTSVSSSHQ